MATIRFFLRHLVTGALLFAPALAVSSASASGDIPPEGKDQVSAAASATTEQKSASPAAASASPAGSPDTAGRMSDPSSAGGKSRASFPGRYGTGYEARQGVGRGAGRGRGGGR